MPLNEPDWWYGPRDDPRVRLARPLSRLWAHVSERRMARRPLYRASMPVLCVGNFTAGGTGKTPLSLAICERLKARGLAATFLSRGYGVRKAAPRWVDPACDTAADVGDEPLLLARVGPTLISVDRVRGAQLIEARTPLPSAIIMDDGLQNPGLAKDLCIAVVDRRRGVGNGEVIPAGPLRARLEPQLDLTDAVVLNGPPRAADAAANELADWLRDHFPGPVLDAHVRPAGDVAWLRQTPVLAFAGIADPQRFFDTLRVLDAKVVETRSFADHHAFSELDARSLLARVAETGALPVTTEKDWVRLVGYDGARAELRNCTRVLPIRLVMAERDELRLDALLDGALGRTSGASAAP